MFKIFGIRFTQDLNECDAVNYNSKFDEVKLFKIWSHRTVTPLIWSQKTITPLGRAAMLKSLIFSKLIHPWMLLPDPPDSFMNDLQKVCFQFVWNGSHRTELSQRLIKDGKVTL